MRDARFINGTAAYTAAFTPPTEPLTAITNTSLLTCHLPYIADGSTNSHSITVNGDTKTEPFGPYDTQEYAAGSHGGSVYFDGNGDYLATDPTNTLDLDGNFTIEGWFRQDGSGATTNYPSIISSTTWNNSVSFSLRFNNTGNAKKFQVAKHGYNNAGTNNIIVGSKTYPYDTWNHFALVRTGASGNQTVTLYVNGENNGSASDNASYNLSYNNAGTKIGGNNWDGANSYVRGYLSDLRVVKGTGVYTAEFTPPTAPLTAITNTSLLLNMQGAKVIDKAQGMAKHLTLAGNTTASTAAYKYLPTSMYFDGNGDYIQLEGMDDRYYGDFTVEMWVKFNSYNSGSGVPNSRIFVSRQGGNHADNLQLIIDYTGTAGSIDVWTNTYHITDGTTNIADNNWHHVAVSRQGTSMKLFIDGTQEGSTATTSQSFLFWDTRLGARDNTADASTKYTGYMSDVRITKGLARYTSNFTAPTAALQG